MKSITLLSLLTVGSLLSISAVHGQVIGVQFDGSGTALSPSQMAGVISSDNYNLVSGVSGGTPTGIALHDNSATLTTATLKYSSLYTNASYGGTPTTPNQILQSGGLSTNSSSTADTFTLTNIPYTSYDVYVYVGPNNGNAGNSFFDDTVTDGTTTYYSYIPGGGLGGYNRATSTTPGTYTANANYVEFTGETAADLTISLKIANNGGTNINGFEIVNTGAAAPEPSEMAYLMAGLLAFGMIGYFRRNRA